MATAAELLKGMNKTYGKGTVTRGITTYESRRLPSGLMEFDLGTGGGFPMGKITEIFGPESSGKTNLAISAVVEAQRIFPDKACVFIDTEGGLETGWLRKMGVDLDRLYIVSPDYAEAVVDMVEKFLEAEDVSLVVVDSIAALVATTELEKSAEAHIMGGNSIVVQKLVRKSVSTLNRVTKSYDNGDRDWVPPLLLINQIRHQIGVMFGSPEKTPGGFAPKFAAALRIRCYGRNIVDKKISAVMPVIKQTDIVIQKWKCPILGTSIKYDMITIPHKGLDVRQTQSWNVVEKYLTAMGHLAKSEKPKGYLMFNEHHATLTSCRDKYYSDPQFRADVLAFLIQEGLKEGGLAAEGELPDDDGDEPVS